VKRAAAFLGLSIVISGFCTAAAQDKKYAIKSGIITFEQAQKVGDIESKRKFIVYFDDFGRKECRDTYRGETLITSNFSDGKEWYIVDYGKKTGTKSFNKGLYSLGTEITFSWNMVADRDKQSGKAKKLANTTIAGKNCEAFELITGNITTQYAGWNSILLYLNVISKSVTSTTKAVKIEENAAVSADKFKIPAGFAVK
jgi:hypothetical protein